MFEDYKVIVVVPSGRERYLSLLIPHLLAEKGLVDECHFWINTRNPLDLDFLEAESRKHPDYFKLVAGSGKIDGNKSISSFYSEEYRQPASIVLKIDDDIVWMAPDSIRKLLEFRVRHPEFFLVSANVWNNQVCDHVKQRAGDLEFSPRIENECMGSLWRSGKLARSIQESLIARIDLGEDGYRSGWRKWVWSAGERFSINFVAWFGHDLAVLSPDGISGPFPGGDDEAYFSDRALRVLGKNNAVCGDSVVAHFAFFPQRLYLDVSGALPKWKSIARRRFPDYFRGAEDRGTGAIASAAILFLCNSDNPVSRENLQLLRFNVPLWVEVIPVHFAARSASPMPGSLELEVEGVDFEILSPRSSLPYLVDTAMLSWWNEKRTADFECLIIVGQSFRCESDLEDLILSVAEVDIVDNSTTYPVFDVALAKSYFEHGSHWLKGEEAFMPCCFKSLNRRAMNRIAEAHRNAIEPVGDSSGLIVPLAEREGIDVNLYNSPRSDDHLYGGYFYLQREGGFSRRSDDGRPVLLLAEGGLKSELFQLAFGLRLAILIGGQLSIVGASLRTVPVLADLGLPICPPSFRRETDRYLKMEDVDGADDLKTFCEEHVPEGVTSITLSGVGFNAAVADGVLDLMSGMLEPALRLGRQGGSLPMIGLSVSSALLADESKAAVLQSVVSRLAAEHADSRLLLVCDDPELIGQLLAEYSNRFVLSPETEVAQFASLCACGSFVAEVGSLGWWISKLIYADERSVFI